MNIIEIIEKKRKNEELTDEEIGYVVNGYLCDEIKDYQMSSLLMAIQLNDMTNNEIFSLTKYMANSGEKLDLTLLGDNVVDKHSTGGVGDKTTLIITPIVDSCGVKVAKMSGKGLGHTGGTIDKLESIPGLKVDMSEAEFLNQVNRIHSAITSQTENIAVADKKIYALRDVTGTVESIPLIASSIMSKKIALGTKKLVLDVKVGSGALLKNIEDARRLSRLMIDIGKYNNMQVICVLTNMDVPLGDNIGNALEVEEAIAVLRDSKQGSLRELCIELASHMVSLGLDISYNNAKQMVINNLDNLNAYNEFLDLIKNQHGDINSLPRGENRYEVKSMTSGYLVNIDAHKLGMLSMTLGAGRINKEDSIDYSAGIVMNKRINDYVNEGDVIMTLYSNKKITEIDNSMFKIANEQIVQNNLILDILK